jgi:hypothetical protein
MLLIVCEAIEHAAPPTVTLLPDAAKFDPAIVSVAPLVGPSIGAIDVIVGDAYEKNAGADDWPLTDTTTGRPAPAPAGSVHLICVCV